MLYSTSRKLRIKLLLAEHAVLLKIPESARFSNMNLIYTDPKWNNQNETKKINSWNQLSKITRHY